MGFAELLALLTTIGKRLLKPKDARPIDDHSSRQTNIFSTVHNTVIVRAGEHNEKYVCKIDQMPEQVIELLKERFSDKTHREDLPEIRLLNSKFVDHIDNYDKYVSRPNELLKKILPYLETNYASVLELSSYVKENYDAGNYKMAVRTKSDIGNQYGKDGNKLCNLYNKGYIAEMMFAYVDKIFESTKDNKELSMKLNDLLKTIIKFSEYIFFIHQQTNVVQVKTKLVEGMSLKKPYIALHGAGEQNIGITKTILDEVGRSVIKDHGYIVQANEYEKQTIRFYDVAIIPAESMTEHCGT